MTGVDTPDWRCKPFSELSSLELYACLQLRSTVFVVEQKCIYLDLDGVDQHCYHLIGYLSGKIIAYSRLVPQHLLHNEASIGRVVTAPEVRGKGYGLMLINESLRQLQEIFGPGAIKIGAQYHLKRFYESFGFKQVSDIYIEDGIEHIYMLRNQQ